MIFNLDQCTYDLLKSNTDERIIVNFYYNFETYSKLIC